MSNMTETEYLQAIPGMEQSILDGAATPLEDCVPESDVTFWNEDPWYRGLFFLWFICNRHA